jgi:hypothetical protein
MTEIDKQLRELLKDKALSISADPGGLGATLERARRRRAGTVVLSAVVVLAGVAATVAIATFISNPRAIQPAPPENHSEVTGRDWDGSITNEYPEIARGEFRGRRWVFEGERGDLGDGIDKVDLTFTIEGPEGSEVATGEVLPSDEVLRDNELALDDGSAHVVFGSTLEDIQTVEAVLDDGSHHGALMFTGYDSRSTITVQYFVLFLSPGADGFLFARDPNGVDWEREPIGSTPAPEPDSGPLLSGAYGGEAWELNAEWSQNRACLNVAYGGRTVEECFEDTGEPGGEGLLLADLSFGDGVRALVGLMDFDLQNLRLDFGDRSFSLHHSLDPHPDLGFPFAVLVDGDSHGRITAVGPDGEEVDRDF